MTTGTVLDTMVVQLVSDISGYVQNMQQAAQVANATAQQVVASVQNIANAQQQQKAAASQLKTQMSAAAAVTQSTLTPLEKYRQSIANVNMLHRQGLVSTETHRRAVANLGKEYKAATSNVDLFITKSMMGGMQLQSIGNGIQSIGRMITASVTVPITAFAALGIKSFVEFDHAMTNSLSIMKTTEEQVQRMRKVALDLGSASPQGPVKLAEAFYFLASAGLNVEQSIAALPLVQQFATAGAFDLAAATNYLADAQSALGLRSADAQQNLKNMTRVADVLAHAANVSNASIEQFSISLTSKAGSSLKVFNKSVEEGTAVLAVYADQGIKAELAGNALDRVLRLLGNASMEEKENHKALGFAVYDAAGKMRNMADIVENLEMILAGMSDQQKAVTLDMLGFDARLQQIILPLIGTSQAIRNYEQQLKNAGGVTEEVANKQMKSFWNQLLITWNSLKVIGIEITERIAPAMAWLNEQIQGAITYWRGLSSGTQNVIIVLIALAACVGPLIIGIGGLIAAIGALATAIVALYVVGGPVTLIVLAITAAVIAAVAWFTVLTGIVTGLVIAFFGFENVKLFLLGVVEGVKELAKKTIGFIANFGENMNKLGEWLKGNWYKIAIDISNYWNNAMQNMAYNGWVAFKKAVGAGGEFASLSDGFKSVMDPLPEFSYEVGKEMIASAEQGVQDATAGGSAAASDYAEKIKEALSTLEDRQNVLDEVKMKVKGLTESMQEQIDTFGMNSRQAQIFKIQKQMIQDLDDMRKKGASQQMIDEQTKQYNQELLALEAMDQKLTALEDEKKAMDEAASAAKRLADATDQLNGVEAGSVDALALVEQYRARFADANSTTLTPGANVTPVTQAIANQVTPTGPNAAASSIQNDGSVTGLLSTIATNTGRPPITLIEANFG